MADQGHGCPAAQSDRVGYFLGFADADCWPAAMLWNVAVPYVTRLSPIQSSLHANSRCFDAGDEFAARQALADWQQVDASEVPRSELFDM